MIRGKTHRHGALVFALLVGALIGFTPRANAQTAWTTNGTPFDTLASGKIVHDVHNLADGSGGVFVSWSDNRSGNFDVYLTRIDSTGALVSGWPANGDTICNASGQQYDPVLATDGSGGVYVAWEDQRSGNAVYATRRTSSGALSSGWTSNGNLVSSSGSSDTLLSIAGDGSGAYLSFEDDGISSVRLAKLTSSGGIALRDSTALQTLTATTTVPDGSGGMWSLQTDMTANAYFTHMSSGGSVAGPAALNSPGSDQAWWPRGVSDGNGGIWITYEFSNPDTAYVMDIAVTHIDGTYYPTAGFPLLACSGKFMKDRPVITRDSHGNAYVAWRDGRQLYGDFGEEVYAQHVFATGSRAPNWPSNGVALRLGDRDPYYLEIASDGLDGAVASWAESNFVYVRARHLNPDTTVAAEVAVANLAGARYDPVIAASALGRVIVDWRDKRGGSSSVSAGYGQRVNAVPVQAPGVSGVSIGSVASEGMNVEWTVPSTSTRFGSPISFALYRSATGAITDANLSSATLVTTLASDSPGNPMCYADAPLSRCHWYWYALVTEWGHGEFSVVSNSPDAKTLCTGFSFTECGGLIVSQPPNDDAPGLPTRLELAAPRPNPAAGSALFDFAIPKANQGQMLRIAVYDVAGRQVRLLRNGFATPGYASVTWDGRDQESHAARPGMYFARMTIGSQVLTQTVVLTH